MKQFSLSAMTAATIQNVNLRSELHGKEHVPAVDLKVLIVAANTMLDQLEAPLRGMFYKRATKNDPVIQPELDGVEPITDTPLLRSTEIEPISLKTKLTGYTVTIDHGLGADAGSNLVLSGCSIDGFVIDCKQGGSVAIEMRIKCSGLSAEVLGALGVMMRLEKGIMLEPPMVQSAIDGSVAAGPGADGADGGAALEPRLTH